MTFWVIVVAVGAWILLAAVLLISLCIMASRYNRSEPSLEDYAAYQEAMEEKQRGGENRVKKMPRVIP